ncbi:AMP-binding protein [Prolixibacter sp. SD074]|uniref:AMP-binding protein n=1 Tax=Prolixibacter sp. SD074 TaxID=2652391 RepID=UPI00127D1268|nr:AMP-binding protein [Prolixibacter sp. SD074]GET30840.1 AMP-binding protein [Prolixibacter sp. SD074]
MRKLNKLTIPEMLRSSFSEFKDKESLVFAGEEHRTYAELETEVRKVAGLLRQLGLKEGDKIGILSSNMPNWGIAFFAVSMIGAVAVPVLPDFSPDEIGNICKHSETRAMFVSGNLYNKVEESEAIELSSVILMETFAVIPKGTSGEQIFSLPSTLSDEYYLTDSAAVEEDALASIIYTSGTTGKSKGVMLTHRNLVWNARQSYSIQRVLTTDRFLSILPLSHTFENTLGLLLPIMYGASVHYLKKPPTARVLLPALQEVKPTLMLSVPLIIEKIYKQQILPKFRKNGFIRTLYRIPVIRKKLNAIAGKKLMETFGGELVFFGIGGAKLDRQVEIFLREAKFPYAIGYGLTETSPLLAGTGASGTRLQGIGPVLEGVKLKLENPDPKTGEGEILAKGPNVMKGYFKEPELTREVLSEDGWFRTGDLGIFDRNGNLYMKGRIKNMILGASGENIYPEEIESVINNFRNVVESLVVQRKGKLVALVHLNIEEIEEKYQMMRDQAEKYVDEKVDETLKELQAYVNSRVSKFSQVQLVLVHPAPFERTPTQKIKRFLYS